MGDRSANTTSALVKALSVASFGLGLSELVAPGKVAAVAGVDDTARSRRVIRALGARECAYDRVKQAARMETERPHAIREAAMSCRNGGTISIVGVYGGLMDKFPIGAVMNRSLTIKTGQCHVHRFMRPLLDRIRNGAIDPTIIVSHHLTLDQAPHGYEVFQEQRGPLHQSHPQSELTARMGKGNSHGE
ncbi:hypothetical protein AWC03_15595 [Mycobacterium europaeum]|uniref:hypothetical protein n=1 Tax=Mycobacterium europaeum TaxID=761804 RepID=UPI000A234383|nr:hypothetical protein [Mycobacterium europaeum]ORV57673.1 hypothetical protein AWC03_15595 [Mycobacterium europaeum]